MGEAATVELGELVGELEGLPPGLDWGPLSWMSTSLLPQPAIVMKAIIAMRPRICGCWLRGSELLWHYGAIAKGAGAGRLGFSAGM